MGEGGECNDVYTAGGRIYTGDRGDHVRGDDGGGDAHTRSRLLGSAHTCSSLLEKGRTLIHALAFRFHHGTSTRPIESGLHPQVFFCSLLLRIAEAGKPDNLKKVLLNECCYSLPSVLPNKFIMSSMSRMV